jgi:predicted nucleic acid-binding protein
VIYWDTSAILKLYVAEQDSPYFLRLLESTQDQIVSSTIVTMEVLCALHRKEHSGDLRPGGAEAIFRRFLADIEMGRIVTIPYGDDLLTEARKLVRLAFDRPRPLPVRSLDAIHVASALVSKATTLVATDKRVREIAALVRLKVLP